MAPMALALLALWAAAAPGAAARPARDEASGCAGGAEGGCLSASAYSDTSSLLQRPTVPPTALGDVAASAHAGGASATRSSYPRRPRSGELWGGPSKSWARQNFTKKVLQTAAAPQLMSFAGPGSEIPESLWGIFWMDQSGKSSIARNSSYPFEMLGTAELLASFGGAGFQSDTGCVTPVTTYGGPHWTFTSAWAGNLQADMFVRSKNTLSMCFRNESYIQIYQKQLTSHAALGPVPVGGSSMAWLLGFPDAGDGYGWTPEDLLSMTMVKTEWGWDRVTHVLQGKEHYACAACGFLVSKLKKLMPESHYPLIQVVDGKGQPTKYWDEFLDHMSSVRNGDEMIVTTPAE